MQNKRVSLLDIAKVFLTIGTVGFGGGLAIIALMQDYCVRRLKWLSIDEFTHGIALGQFIGPFALNAAIFIGYRLRGFLGALVSSIFFLIPSVILVIALSFLYLHYHKIPTLQAALKGLNPVVVALILSAAFQMGKNKFKSFEPFFLMAVAFLLASVFKLSAFVILLSSIAYALLRAKFFLVEDKR